MVQTGWREHAELGQGVESHWIAVKLEYDDDGLLMVTDGYGGQDMMYGAMHPGGNEFWRVDESDSITTLPGNSDCFKYYSHYTSAYIWNASPMYGSFSFTQ